jgi:hypothetical protein
MKARNTGRKTKRPFSEAQFATQWRAVRREYPLVAMRYLEALEFILDERRQLRLATSQVLPLLGVCDPKSPQYLGPKICKLLNPDPGSVPPVVPPRPCRLPTDESGIEGYLGCLEKRIAQLG